MPNKKQTDIKKYFKSSFGVSYIDPNAEFDKKNQNDNENINEANLIGKPYVERFKDPNIFTMEKYRSLFEAKGVILTKLEEMERIKE